MVIKAIVLDIDGTLLNSNKVITLKTKRALLAAQQKGIKVILASGRPTTGMQQYAEQLELARYGGLLVSYNGAKVIDCQTGRVLFNEALPIKTAQAVLEHLKQFDVKVMIDRDDYLYVNDVYDNIIHHHNQPINIIAYEARGGQFKLAEQTDLALFANFELNKILTAGEPAYLMTHYEAMMAPFKTDCHCVFTAPFYFEFTAQGIDKAKALASVLEPCGICAAEVLAIGDGQNDISMIQYAGVGVAMANAVEELQAVANYQTLSNDEDGIATILARLL